MTMSNAPDLTTAAGWVPEAPLPGWSDRPDEAAGAAPDLPAAAETLGRVTAPLTDYPFPLRHGLHVYLRLPADLTGAEADRLAGFVRALARQDKEETGG